MASARTKLERRKSGGGGKDTLAMERNDANCGDCDRPVRSNQNAMFCDLCEHWFHIGCQHMHINEYKLYMHEDYKATWFCKQCNSRVRHLSKENKAIKEENTMLKEENTGLKRANEELKEQIKLLEELQEQFHDTVNKVDGLKTQIKQEILEEVLEDLDERREKEEKKSNLIIFNVEEKTYQSRQERMDSELKFCEEIFQSIETEATTRNIIEIRRLGKYNAQGTNANPRPLLVKMTDTHIKWNIIKNGKKLRDVRNHMISKLRIVPDLTRKEREADKKLKEELKAKRDVGETDWIIKKGKLQRKSFLLTNPRVH